MVGEGGNLRQVSDAEYLVGARQRLQLFPHRFGRPTANSGVDLIEHQRALGPGVSLPAPTSPGLYGRLQGQQDPGEFPS